MQNTSLKIRLRGHHLLCMLTYQSEGYTADFVENYDKVIENLKAGATIILVEGADEICRPIETDREHHCHNESVRCRDVEALQAVSQILGSELRIGDEIDLSTQSLAELRRAFSEGSLRQACKGCQWDKLCTRISRTGFRSALLKLDND